MLRLVIADDGSIVREALRMVLTGFAPDVEVRVSANGAETITLCDEYQPHVLFIDEGMRSMTGSQVIRQIARRSAPPVIVGMSANDQIGEKMKRAGADHFFDKAGGPVDLKVLWDDICSSLDGNGSS